MRLLFLLVWLLSVPVFALDLSKNVQNSLGYANRDGGVSSWWDFRERCTLSIGGQDFPIKLNFSSRQRHTQRSILGEGWWFPLFEANFVNERPGRYTMRTIGGDVIYLYSNVDLENSIDSRDLKWTGVVNKEEKTVEMKHESGWGVTYVEGLISFLEAPNGEIVKWVRTEEEWRVESSESGVLASFELNDDRRAERVSFTTSSELPEMVVSYQDVLFRKNRDRYKTLASISFGGYAGEFVFGRAKHGKHQTLNLHQGEKNTQFVWLQSDGEIVSCPINSGYKVQMPPDSRRWADADIKAVPRSGQRGRTGTSFNPGKMSKTIWAGDTRSVKTYVGTPGPAFGKTKSLEIFEGNVKVKSVRYYHDASGRVLRRITEGADGRKTVCVYLHAKTAQEVVKLDGDLKAKWQSQDFTQESLVYDHLDRLVIDFNAEVIVRNFYKDDEDSLFAVERFFQDGRHQVVREWTCERDYHYREGLINGRPVTRAVRKEGQLINRKVDPKNFDWSYPYELNFWKNYDDKDNDV